MAKAGVPTLVLSKAKDCPRDFLGLKEPRRSSDTPAYSGPHAEGKCVRLELFMKMGHIASGPFY